MKNFLWIITVLFLVACTTTHQGTKSVNIKELSLKERPLRVTVVPGEKISGTSRCTYILGIPFRAPAYGAYGAELDTSSGNFATDRCTHGAFYRAIVSSNADVIISPQYKTNGKSFLCLPWIGCFYNDHTVTVSGYKGTYQFDNRDDSNYRSTLRNRQ